MTCHYTDEQIADLIIEGEIPRMIFDVRIYGSLVSTLLIELTIVKVRFPSVYNHIVGYIASCANDFSTTEEELLTSVYRMMLNQYGIDLVALFRLNNKISLLDLLYHNRT